MKVILSWLSVTLMTVLISACSAVGSTDGGAGEIEIRSGKIEQISLTQMQTNHDSGVGAVLGGLGGRDVAMVAGALAGAVGGNYAEKKKYDQPVEAQQIIVRVNSGVLVSVTQPINPSLTKGSKVYIQGSGNDARVVPQGS